jgi:hypothetical protein
MTVATTATLTTTIGNDNGGYRSDSNVTARDIPSGWRGLLPGSAAKWLRAAARWMAWITANAATALQSEAEHGEPRWTKHRGDLEHCGKTLDFRRSPRRCGVVNITH